MTLKQAGELIESGKLMAERGDSFELVWAKHTLRDHAKLMARVPFAPEPERLRAIVQRRHDEAFALVLAHLLSKE